MNGSDKVEMTINIGGEFLKLSTTYDQQSMVKDAVSAVKQFCTKLRKNWPDCNDRQILAMAAYQFAFWHRELEKMQEEALELTEKTSELLNS